MAQVCNQHFTASAQSTESACLLRDGTASAKDAFGFQSKIKTLEQGSVSEANCKTKEGNKKGQLTKIFDQCYSAMRAKFSKNCEIKIIITCVLYQG